MAEQTTNLELPFILSSQAQKHITHNEALQRLDALVQLVITDATSSLPDAPADGACYFITADATGVWAARAGAIAAWQDGAWTYMSPRIGWIAWFASLNLPKVWTGLAWSELASTGATAVSELGINASADAINRLSLSSSASLFNHDGADHQMKINKAAEADTASLLFQTAWSGRAEMGLAGDDAFSLKVSSDGAGWATALEALPGGALRFPNRPLVSATLGEITLSPASLSQTGFTSLSVSQGGFALGAALSSGHGETLVAPCAGVYWLTLKSLATASAAYSLGVIKNSTAQIATLSGGNTAGIAISQSTSALVTLAEGDELTLIHGGAASLDFGLGKTELLAALIA